MRFALFVAFLAIGVSCMVAETIISWGDVHSTKFGREIRVNERFVWFRVQNRTVTYRTTSASQLVRGIMYIDYQAVQSKPQIVQGGIDHPTATVNIVSQRNYGINAAVRFYV